MKTCTRKPRLSSEGQAQNSHGQFMVDGLSDPSAEGDLLKGAESPLVSPGRGGPAPLCEAISHLGGHFGTALLILHAPSRLTTVVVNGAFLYCSFLGHSDSATTSCPRPQRPIVPPSTLCGLAQYNHSPKMSPQSPTSTLTSPQLWPLRWLAGGCQFGQHLNALCFCLGGRPRQTFTGTCI